KHSFSAYFATPSSYFFTLSLHDALPIYLTEAQKNKIFDSFKAQSGTFLSSPEFSIFKALQTTAKANNLSVMQVLKTVDEVGAKKAGAANANLFQKKISAWLNTKQGTLEIGRAHV